MGEPKLEDMTPYIEMILDEHNYYRNLVASGEVECFYPAVRMPILVSFKFNYDNFKIIFLFFQEWDWELAETAEYNVKSCVFAHDQCRSTEKFPMAGQNIYMAKTIRLNVTIEGFIRESIFLWFEEQFDADYTILLSYRKTR